MVAVGKTKPIHTDLHIRSYVFSIKPKTISSWENRWKSPSLINQTYPRVVPSLTLAPHMYCMTMLQLAFGLLQECWFVLKRKGFFCWNFDFHHIFCHIAATSWPASCNWLRKKEYPVKTLTLSHWQLSHLPWPEFEPLQWQETASSQWHRLRPHGHQARRPTMKR